MSGLAEIQQLQKVQNRAARIITGSNYDAPNKPFIKDLGWKRIENVIQYELQIVVYKFRNGRALQYLYNMFVAKSSDSSYNLRGTETDLKLPKQTSPNGQKGLSYSDSKMWKSLPTESKLESTLAPIFPSFKKSLVHDMKCTIKAKGSYYFICVFTIVYLATYLYYMFLHFHYCI